MRDIKFRGKRTDNGEWVYGYYCRYGWMGKEKDYIIPNYASALYTFEIIPETVGQSTGLCDKNSTEIYEGDILGKSGYWSLVVEYQRIMPLNSIQYSNSRGWSIYGFDSSSWEVIGNIHDAEMLEVQND
jgi:uncharacterized phage protein (TIGR01671 family)